MEILKYRKDVSSPWQDIVALVGPQGEPGKDGLNGKDGVNGKDGHTPVKGVDYFDGEQGPQGIQGEPGPAGRDGAPFTYDDFTPEQLAALRGPQGAQGPQGEKGEKGDKGDTYVLTETDKSDIANLVLAGLPVSEEVSF